MHHNDAGSQYTSLRFTEHLALEGIAPSIGTVGDAYDNGLMECLIGLYKTECIRTRCSTPGPYKTVADVEYATLAWVDWWNNRRLHGTLGMITPTSSSKPTTLPSPRRAAPFESGREPGTIHPTAAALNSNYAPNPRQPRPPEQPRLLPP